MTKVDQINYLILQKGYMKVKVNSFFSVPTQSKIAKKEAQTRTYIQNNT